MAAISWSRKLLTWSISRTPRRLVEIVGDLRDRLDELSGAGQLARRYGRAGVLAVFGVPDVGQAFSVAGAAFGCCRPHTARWPSRSARRVLPVGQLHSVGAAPTQRR
jgi:hypothetical protein